MLLLPSALGLSPSYRLAPVCSVVATKWPVTRALRIHQGSITSTRAASIAAPIASWRRRWPRSIAKATARANGVNNSQLGRTSVA